MDGIITGMQSLRHLPLDTVTCGNIVDIFHVFFPDSAVGAYVPSSVGVRARQTVRWAFTQQSKQYTYADTLLSQR